MFTPKKGTFASIGSTNGNQGSNGPNTNEKNEINNFDSGNLISDPIRENVNELNLKEIIKDENLKLEKIFNSEDINKIYILYKKICNIQRKFDQLQEDNDDDEDVKEKLINYIRFYINNSLYIHICEFLKNPNNYYDFRILELDPLFMYIKNRINSYINYTDEEKNEFYEYVGNYLANHEEYDTPKTTDTYGFYGAMLENYKPMECDYTDEEKNDLCDLLYKEVLLKYQDTEELGDFEDYVIDWVRIVFFRNKYDEYREEFNRCESDPAVSKDRKYRTYRSILCKKQKYMFELYHLIQERLYNTPQKYYIKMMDFDSTRELIEFFKK